MNTPIPLVTLIAGGASSLGSIALCGWNLLPLKRWPLFGRPCVADFCIECGTVQLHIVRSVPPEEAAGYKPVAGAVIPADSALTVSCTTCSHTWRSEHIRYDTLAWTRELPDDVVEATNQAAATAMARGLSGDELAEDARSWPEENHRITRQALLDVELERERYFESDQPVWALKDWGLACAAISTLFIALAIGNAAYFWALAMTAFVWIPYLFIQDHEAKKWSPSQVAKRISDRLDRSTNVPVDCKELLQWGREMGIEVASTVKEKPLQQLLERRTSVPPPGHQER